MSIASHHQHLRKRNKKLLHPYPTVNPKVKRLDEVVSVVSYLFPLTALPQIYTIWIRKSLEGVSFLTWALFFVMTIPLLWSIQ